LDKSLKNNDPVAPAQALPIKGKSGKGNKRPAVISP